VGSFKTSGRFGLIGVFVVAVLAAVIANTMGQGQAKPKDATALIFGIIGLYIVVLFLLQTRDLSKAEAADSSSAPPPSDIDNPATLDEGQLFAALAIRPIDADAVRARKAIWGSTRASIHTAMLVCALIFISVPPIYLLDTWVPFIIGAPLIGAIALFKSVALLRTGGDLDQAYERSNRAMAPLGLAVTERPEVRIEPKGVAPYRIGTGIHGALVMEGERHGHAVTVRMPSEGVRSASEVQVSGAAPEFEFKVRDGRLKAKKGAPEALSKVLAGVPNSTRWNGVHGAGGPDGIAVERKGGTAGDWLLDLWLAERLAAAVPHPAGLSA
jgi:hypothetical protein